MRPRLFHIEALSLFELCQEALYMAKVRDLIQVEKHSQRVTVEDPTPSAETFLSLCEVRPKPNGSAVPHRACMFGK